VDARYEVIIFWSEEDEAFVAEVPELLGCMADGKTRQQALLNDSPAEGAPRLRMSETSRRLKKQGKHDPALCRKAGMAQVREDL